MTARDGKLVTRSGMEYAALQLPRYTTMTLELARKVSDLAKEGVAISGPKPMETPGLTGYPASEARLKDITDAAWNAAMPQHVDAGPIATLLSARGVKPDFTYQLDPPVTKDAIKSITGRSEVKPGKPEPLEMPTKGLNWIHRQLPEGDFYFVANPQYRDVNALLSFRAETAPELWYPDSGEVKRPAVYTNDGAVELPLHFGPAGSVFVVFKKEAPAAPAAQVVELKRDGNVLFGAGQTKPAGVPQVWLSADGKLMLDQQAQPGKYELTLASGEKRSAEVAAPADGLSLAGPWQVTFPPNLGAPAQAEFATLTDWTKSDVEGIKYFSGTATYHTTFTLDAAPKPGTRVRLNLGDVKVMAQVSVNGKDLGVLWKPPFAVDVTDAVKAGENRLEVKVVNLWPNRMIGDEQYPDDSSQDGQWTKGRLTAWPDWVTNHTPRPEPRRITFTTFKYYDKNSPLISSGLLGPVKLETLPVVEVETGK